MFAVPVDPATQGACAVGAEYGFVSRFVADVPDGCDLPGKWRWEWRFSEFVAFPAMHAAHMPGIGIMYMLGSYIKHFVAPKSTAHAKCETDVVFGIVGVLEELLNFGLGEPDFFVVLVVVSLEVHGCRFARYPVSCDDK